MHGFGFKEITFIPLCTALLGLTSQAVHAAQLDLIGSFGTWGQPIGGQGELIWNQVGFGNGIEQQIRWGNPAARVSSKSGLGFTGVAASSIATDSLFQVGILRHFNQPILAGSQLSQVPLTVWLSFQNPQVTQTFDFNFLINETPNVLPCQYPGNTVCPDVITFETPDASQNFAIGDTQYTLKLKGFRKTESEPPVEQFLSEEGQTNWVYLYGEIATTPPKRHIPEPSAIAGLSLIPLYALTCSRKTKR